MRIYSKFRVLSPLCAVAATLAVSTSAGAADGAGTGVETQLAEPVRLEFQGPDDCPGSEDFLQAVYARTARVRSAGEGEAARTFRVSLVRVEGQVRGELAVQELGNLDESGKRTIEGESCSEVVDALALFAALSVDPDARTSRLPDPPPEARTEPRFEPPPAPPFAPPAAREKKPEPPRHESVFRSLAGAHAGVVGAGVPAWLFMFAPFVEGRLERSGPPRAFSPALRLSFSKLDAETAVTSQGTADLDLMTVRADACPVTIGVMRAVAARPCLTASAGRLSAVGNTDHPRRVALSWWSAGALFRAEWSVAGLLQIEAATGLDLPIRRDAFYFQPSTPIYTVPRALGFASAGAGFWFW